MSSAPSRPSTSAASVTSSCRPPDGVARRERGRLDVLVNCAGVPGRSLETLDVTDDEWERVFAINAHGTFWFCRAAARGMVRRGYGRIVNVASIAGKEGNPMAAAYSGSKG